MWIDSVTKPKFVCPMLQKAKILRPLDFPEYWDKGSFVMLMQCGDP